MEPAAAPNEENRSLVPLPAAPSIEPPARDLAVEQEALADTETADAAARTTGDTESQIAGGDWTGVRGWLHDEGIDLTLGWVADLQGNATGGQRRKVRYFQDVGVAVTVDLERLVGLPNTQLEAGMSSRAGNDLSSDIGNDFVVSQACCGATIRLTTLSLETTWVDDRVALRAGRLSVGDDFATSPSFALFVNSAFDNNPAALAFDVPFTAYPVYGWGARLRLGDEDALHGRIGVYSAEPHLADNATHGVDFSLDGSAGALWIVEATLPMTATGETGLLPANFHTLPVDLTVGVFVNSGPAADLADPSVTHRGDAGVYSLLEAKVWAESDARDARSVDAFVSFVGAPDARVNRFPWFANGGLSAQGLLPGRPQDVALIGGAMGVYSQSLAPESRTIEAVLEWGYQIAVTLYLTIQPDFQWVIRPQGTGTIPDALVIGVQTAVSF